jgi:hypothetical protein
MFGREKTLEVKPYSEIQIEEQRRGGMAQDVKVPRAQAAWVAAAAMLVCLFAPVAVRALGMTIFWLAVFVIGAGTFCHALYVAIRYDQALVQGFTLLVLFTGSVFALVAGGVGLALWRVSVLTFPNWQITSQFVNFVLALPFIGSLVFLALMSLAFVQELAYRSPFLEKALFALATNNKPPWWYAARPLPAPGIRPIATNYRAPPDSSVEYIPPPEPELTETEMFLRIVRKYKTLARDRLRGAKLANGATLTKNCWYRCIEDLVNRNYLVRDDNGKTRWACGADADVALAAYHRPPPHCDAEWADG